MDMNNIDSTHGSTYETAGLHRARDPGSGAFSPYHSSITRASMPIPAGSELLASYGDDWIPDVPGAQVTLDPQMDEADAFFYNDYLPFIQKHDAELPNEMKQALWDFTSNTFPVYNQAMTNLPRFSWSEVEEFIHNPNAIVRKKPQEEEEDDDDDEISISRYFLQKSYMRSLEWLQTHPNSYCQDHLRPHKSTIPQAGRGAFATRDLPVGTVVGYSPLIHIGKDGRAILDIEYTDVYQKGTRHMYDLILNYSFGHPNSTLLLTPYGGMVNYINHASGSKANVKVRFPDKELVAHKPEWLEKDPEFFHHAIDKIGLSFEYVALRDIAIGEEVFMDYGPVWERAWEKHLQTWQPIENAGSYVHSTEWDEPFLRTVDELKLNPYPGNLQTMCIRSYTILQDDGGAVYVDIEDDDAVRTDRWHCDVMARRGNEDDGYVYDVNLLTDIPQTNEDGEEDEEAESELVWVYIRDMDANAVMLTDKSFTADWHLPNAFRHYIQIPDDVIPEPWLNGPDPYELGQDDEDNGDDDEEDD